MDYIMDSKSPARLLSILGLSLILISATAIAELPVETPKPEAIMPSSAAITLPTLSGTIYISDDLKTALRTGASTRHRISAFLSSGTPLTVKSSSNDWVEVEVKDSTKSGWVSRQNVQKQLGAKALLIKKEANISQLKKNQEAMHREQQEQQSQLSKTQQNLTAITEQFDRLNKEYEELQAISKSAIKNHGQIQNMREQIAALKTQSGELEIANALLKQDNYNRGIVHALIAVIFGILITLIIPKMKKKRSSNGWD